MIIFKKVIVKNFFSVGNSPIEINLNDYKKTLIVGKNGSAKCVDINTIVEVRDKRSNEVYRITMGELYDAQKKQTERGENT